MKIKKIKILITYHNYLYTKSYSRRKAKMNKKINKVYRRENIMKYLMNKYRIIKLKMNLYMIQMLITLE